MSKFLIVLAFGIGLSLSISSDSDPTPVPVPYMDYQRMLGTWYGIWSFPNQTENVTANCWINNVEISTGGNITWNSSVYLNDTQLNTTTYFIVANPQGSIWNSSSTQLIWMAVDPVNYNWGMAAYNNQVYVIAKTKSVDKSVIQAQVQLAKSEGYLMETNLTIFYNNTNCTELIEF